MARPKKPAEEPIIPPWFKVWTGWNDSIAMLTNEQAGELLKAMVSFSIDGIEPKFRDSLLKAYWGFMATQMRLDRQKYINQVESNRRAGKKSAENKAKINAKKPTKKSGVSEAGNTDGTRDSQQVLTSVNEERRKKGEEEPKEPKEKKRIEVTDSLDKANDTFDVNGYNIANDLWYKNNGHISLTPAEKKYLQRCVAEHGANFICGCIMALKNQKRMINTDNLRTVIKELKEQYERAEKERQAIEYRISLIDQIDTTLKDAGDVSIGFKKWGESYQLAVLDLLHDGNGGYHMELVTEALKSLKDKQHPNTPWLLRWLEERKKKEEELTT